MKFSNTAGHDRRGVTNLAKILFIAAGIVNLLPTGGALSADYLGTLYGLALDDPNLIILMKHRAVLFGVVGALLVASAFRELLRPLALAAGLLSMLSFVLIACLERDYNAELQRVILVDLAASALLVVAAVADWRARVGKTAT